MSDKCHYCEEPGHYDYDDVPLCRFHRDAREWFNEGWWAGLRQGKKGLSCRCNGACYGEAEWEDFNKLLENKEQGDG